MWGRKKEPAKVIVPPEREVETEVIEQKTEKRLPKSFRVEQEDRIPQYSADAEQEVVKEAVVEQKQAKQQVQSNVEVKIISGELLDANMYRFVLISNVSLGEVGSEIAWSE